MRPIKFRAWDKSKNQFVGRWMMLPNGCPHLLRPDDFERVRNWHRDHNTGLLEQYVQPGIVDFSDFYAAGNFIIEQFTGLHDKNGKEIYEGDIMAKDATHPYRYEVIYKTSRTRFLLNCLQRRRQLIALTDQWVKKEVIGNIHENPELI